MPQICLSVLEATLLCRIGQVSQHPSNSHQKAKEVLIYKGVNVKKKKNLAVLSLSWVPASLNTPALPDPSPWGPRE